MNAESQSNETRDTLERLARSGEGLKEVSVSASPGSAVQVFAAKVESLASYNVYNVSVIVPAGAGALPEEIGAHFTAFNLAESFIQTGGLVAGTYVVVSRVGEGFVFYAKP